MRIDVLEGTAISELYPQWNELLEHSNADPVFGAPEWSLYWGKAFGETQNIKLITAWKGTQLVGIFPVILKSSLLKDGGGERLEFVGGSLADYALPVVDKEREVEILRFLFQAAFELKVTYDLLALVHIPEEMFPSFKAALEDLRWSFFWKGDVAPFIKIFPHFSYEKIKQTWSSSHRGDIKRQKKRLAELGKIEFVSQAPREEKEKYFFEFYRLYSSKWGKKEIEKFIYNLAFYHPLSSFSYLSIDQFPIAFHFGFKSKDRFYYYMPSYKGEFENYSPGKVLLSYLIERACQEKLFYFDFLLGKEEYKYRWGVNERSVKSLFIPTSLKGRFASWWLSTGKGQVRKVIKRLGGKE